MNDRDRILLAIDLQANDKTGIKSLARGVKQLYGTRPVTLEPVFVLQRATRAVGQQLKNEIGDVGLAVRTHFESVLGELALPDVTSPTVLYSADNSTRRAAKTLADYAFSSGCQGIAVNTRSRRGFGRLVLGSFAESLVQQATVPLLVLNPQSLFRRPVSDRVLFPTDLSPESKEALFRYAPRAYALRQHLVLFHQCERVLTLGFDPFYTVPLPRDVVEQEWRTRRLEGEEWVRGLGQLGIGAELVVDETPSAVVDGIVAAARRQRAGLIVLAARKGARYGFALGGITYGVMRKALRPVWVLPLEESMARGAEPARRQVS